MTDLLLHCGAHAVPRAEVDSCNTPSSTQTWQPIPHHTLLQLVEQTLIQSGLEVINQAHALGRDGDHYFGLMHVQNGQQHDDYGLVVGLRNSHDQSYPAGFVVGSTVFVCDNLSFSGEVVLARRHTRFIMRDLPQMVERAVGQLGSLRVQQDQRIEQYKQSELSDSQVNDLLISCLDTRVLPVTRLPVALNEWRRPSHPEFAEDGKTAWRFFNGVTEALKGRNLDQLPERTQALHGLVDTACGLAMHRN